MDIKELLKLINDKKNKKCYGRKYYYYKPENVEKSTTYYIDGQAHEEENEKANEVYTNWFKVLVNQKIDYSLSKPVIVDKNIPFEFNVEEILDKLTLNASLDSKSWLHLVINSQNKLDWVIVKDCEIIPIYDKHNKYIVNIIRFWETEKENDKNKKILNVEIWDNNNILEIKIEDEKIITSKLKTHYMEILKYNDTEEKINPKGFGFLPFIPLNNNKNTESDIVNVKSMLDIYNEISTGFINNVRKFQEMLMKLRGYGGQDLDEFMNQLKKYRVIPVDENGDFDYLKVEIPVEARKVLLDTARKNIFVLGRGVDPTEDFGGSITNVVIKSKYSNLDMKNSDMEKQIRIFYNQLIVMLNMYNNSNIDNEIIFNRTQIFNESEQIDNCVKSQGIISNKTILKNHPFVDDVEEEIKLIEEENKNNPTMENNNLGVV